MKYTEDYLKEVVKHSKTMSEVFEKLKIKNYGGTACHIYKLIKKFKIDRSHFHKKNHHRKRPIEYYLSNEGYMGSSDLRERLFKENLKQRCCEVCKIENWMGNYLSFELHHIDGDRTNNNLSNLQILCPNCHYCQHYSKPLPIKKEYKYKPKLANRKVKNRPAYEELISLIDTIGYVATGKKYNVSDNAVRKWIKCYKNADTLNRTETFTSSE